MIDAPNLIRIQRCLTDNTIFENDEIEVILNANTQIENSSFEISLTATRKIDSKFIRIETRVALEKHVKGKGHHHPHLQIDNFASNEEILGKGKLHILLLVETKEELEKCCEGFAYVLSKIMDVIEEIFDMQLNLKEFFFYLEPLKVLEPNQEILQGLIIKSFEQNKLIFDQNGLNLIEYKGKKNDPPLDTNNLFKILRILVHLKVLNPLLLKPLYEIISKNNQIVLKCESFTFEDFQRILTNKSSSELKHYNKVRFIEDVGKK